MQFDLDCEVKRTQGKKEKNAWLWKLKITVLLEVSGHIHQKLAGQVGGRMGGCMDPWIVNRPQTTAQFIAILSNPSDQSHLLYFPLQHQYYKAQDTLQSALNGLFSILLQCDM